jgi:hypothetical protein
MEQLRRRLQTALTYSFATVSGVLSTGRNREASLTGFIKKWHSFRFTTVSAIAIADVTGAVSSVNEASRMLTETLLLLFLISVNRYLD